MDLEFTLLLSEKRTVMGHLKQEVLILRSYELHQAYRYVIVKFPYSAWLIAL